MGSLGSEPSPLRGDNDPFGIGLPPRPPFSLPRQVAGGHLYPEGELFLLLSPGYLPPRQPGPDPPGEPDPLSSAPMPGYAPGVSRNESTGRLYLAAKRIIRSALR